MGGGVGEMGGEELGEIFPLLLLLVYKKAAHIINHWHPCLLYASEITWLFSVLAVAISVLIISSM